MVRVRFLPAIAVCLLVAAAHAVTMRLTQADGARVQVVLHQADILRIDLPAQPAAGSQWSVLGHAPAPLEVLAATQRVFGGRLSNQGTSSFAWRAVSDGEADLTLVYGPASTRATHPDRTMAIHVTVEGEPLAPELSAPDVLLQMEKVGAYARQLPCGDCSAVKEQLLLYRAPQESVFILRRVYQDAPSGTLTSVLTGSWNAAPGAIDTAAIIYNLGEQGSFRLEGDRLLPLDAQQIPVPPTSGQDNAFHAIAFP